MSLSKKSNSSDEKYAVIFRSQRHSTDEEAYQEATTKIAQIIMKQPGCLGHTSFRDPDGRGVTISYWDSRKSVLAWRNQEDHQEVQKKGPTWYQSYTVEICKVEREYSFPMQES